MTRKQAVHKIIEILSNDTNNDYTELCEKLQEISQDMNNYRWTKNKIIDAIQQYYIDNQKLPLAKTCIKNKDLPTQKAIETTFGITYSDFLKTYFSKEIELTYQYKEDVRLKEFERRKEKHIENFKKYYIEMNYPSLKVYKKNKPKESPSVRYLTTLLGVKNWNDILRYCGFAVFKYQRKENTKLETEIEFVNTTTHELSEINKKLNNILNNSKS